MKEGNVMSAKDEHTDTTRNDSAPNDTESAAQRHSRRRLIAVLGVTGALVAVAGLGSVSFLSTTGHAATLPTNCQANPSVCGFPDATNSGVPSGTTLKTVPGQVSSGAGWSWNAPTQTVNVTGDGAVLSGLSVSGTVNITGDNVTLSNDKVLTNAAYGISLRHTDGVTIQNSTISGLNITSGRVGAAIGDAYGDSTGMVVQGNNISAFRSAVQLTGGLVAGNYIHDPGYIQGDHTNGVIANGGTSPLTINHNTILINLSQTDAITLNTMTVDGPVTNKIISNNLMGGGAYVIYAGTAFGHTTSGVQIENNRFGQVYYPKSGQFGPVAYVSVTGVAGNTWTGNVWDSTAATVKAP
jgi:hypothetical protein